MAEDSLNVLILGMHRSGTSAVAGLLRAAGLYAGSAELLMEEHPQNPRGFIERLDLVDFNDRFLAALGWSWDTPEAAPLSNPPQQLELVTEGRELIAREMARHQPWLIKDPRLSLLLPWWRQILLDRFVPVVVVREPAEVAWSLATRDGFSVEQGLSLWAAYHRHLAAGLDGLHVIVIDYSSLTDDVLSSVSDLLAELGRAGVRNEFDHDAAVAAVEPLLRRATQPAAFGLSGELSSSILSVRNAWMGEPLRVFDRFHMAPGEPTGWEASLLRAHREARRRQSEALAATTEVESLRTAIATLGAERDALQAHREDALAEIHRLTGELADQATQAVRLHEQAAALTADRDGLVAERSKLVAEREELTADRDRLLTDQRNLTVERDDLAAERDTLAENVDRLSNELNAAGEALSQLQFDHLRRERASLRGRLARLRRRVLRAAIRFVPQPLIPSVWHNPLFDAAWYLETYADVRETGMSPERHYRRHGNREGRQPNRFFDPIWYLGTNPDVAKSGLNPLDHYYFFGADEGRDPSPQFQTAWYSLANPDVAASGMNPLLHFLRYGRAEGRSSGASSVTPGLSSPPPQHAGRSLRSGVSSMFRRSKRLAAVAAATVQPAAVIPLSLGYIPGGESATPPSTAQRSGRYELRNGLSSYVYVPPRRPDNAEAAIDSWSRKPTFSIVVPVFNTPRAYLEALLASVLAQWYPAWQLVLCDDASTDDETRQVLSAIADDRIKIVRSEVNGGISAATNSAIAAASGEYVVFLDHDDELTEDCLFELARFISRHDVDLLYSDEDKLAPDASFVEPHFKPDWSPDTLMSTMYIGHVTCIRRSILDSVGPLRSEFDGSQDWDLALRVTEQTSRIGHVPKVLYHWRISPGSVAADLAAKPAAVTASVRAREAALARRHLDGTLRDISQVAGYAHVVYGATETASISIIIPTRDNLEVLRRCLQSIYAASSGRYEVVVVDNGSTDPACLEYMDYVRQSHNARLVRHDAPFNFAHLCNLGAAEAAGSVLLFLNDDTEVLSGDWLQHMSGYAGLPHVGAVGAKLLYPSKQAVQHAGIVNLVNGPMHALLKSGPEAPGYFMRNLLPYNWLAVTGACMMIERSKFELVGRFDESFAVAYNDVELCIRLLKRGLFNVVCPAVRLIHHESYSRGRDDASSERAVRLGRELRQLYNVHPDFYAHDPFHNPNFHPNDVLFGVAA